VSQFPVTANQRAKKTRPRCRNYHSPKNKTIFLPIFNPENKKVHRHKKFELMNILSLKCHCKTMPYIVVTR